jgi:hypothetical protein
VNNEDVDKVVHRRIRNTQSKSSPAIMDQGHQGGFGPHATVDHLKIYTLYSKGWLSVAK